MLSQELGCPDLIIPGKTAGAISCELNIVGWISIDEIVSLNRQLFQIETGEVPASKHFLVGCEVHSVVHRFVLTERNVELAAAIEATEAVKASAI